ncbi:MAG: glutaredoxin family protein [Parahaliea sp.]
MTKDKKMELLGTPACHLCELAEALLEACVQAGYPLAYTKVDIACDDVLFARYGLSIPVLRDGARELHWPFGPRELVAFCEAA